MTACFPYICVACQASPTIFSYIILFEFRNNPGKKTGDKRDCHHFAVEEIEAPQVVSWLRIGSGALKARISSLLLSRGSEAVGQCS